MGYVLDLKRESVLLTGARRYVEVEYGINEKDPKHMYALLNLIANTLEGIIKPDENLAPAYHPSTAKHLMKIGNRIQSKTNLQFISEKRKELNLHWFELDTKTQEKYLCQMDELLTAEENKVFIKSEDEDVIDYI